jgi:hypothetical protein
VIPAIREHCAGQVFGPFGEEIVQKIHDEMLGEVGYTVHIVGVLRDSILNDGLDI